MCCFHVSIELLLFTAGLLAVRQRCLSWGGPPFFFLHGNPLPFTSLHCCWMTLDGFGFCWSRCFFFPTDIHWASEFKLTKAPRRQGSKLPWREKSRPGGRPAGEDPQGVASFSLFCFSRQKQVCVFVWLRGCGWADSLFVFFFWGWGGISLSLGFGGGVHYGVEGWGAGGKTGRRDLQTYFC